jgi:hypothetical protein
MDSPTAHDNQPASWQWPSEFSWILTYTSVQWQPTKPPGFCTYIWSQVPQIYPDSAHTWASNLKIFPGPEVVHIGWFSGLMCLNDIVIVSELILSAELSRHCHLLSTMTMSNTSNPRSTIPQCQHSCTEAEDHVESLSPLALTSTIEIEPYISSNGSCTSIIYSPHISTLTGKKLRCWYDGWWCRSSKSPPWGMVSLHWHCAPCVHLTWLLKQAVENRQTEGFHQRRARQSVERIVATT